MSESRLERIKVKGFRSLRDIDLELSPVTVLIGPNGAGKSNLLSLLRAIPLIRDQSLRRFVGEQGGASALLHYGPSTTPTLSIQLRFAGNQGTFLYDLDLHYAAGDAFRFARESVRLDGGPEQPHYLNAESGHAESLLKAASEKSPQLQGLSSLISRMGFFHFHDTSLTSQLRQNSRQADNRSLRSDGQNLASFLYRLRTSTADGTRQSWQLIESLVQRVAPFIKALMPDLVDPDRPDQSAVRLYWIDERDHRFDVHDLSDGTLRAIALIAALAQPASSMPLFITIDEPELGLHPAAIGILAALIHSASAHCQVLVATQSPTLLDEFAPEEVVVVERSKGETSFKRLAPAELRLWLEEYTLSELYEKNVLGGRP